MAWSLWFLLSLLFMFNLGMAVWAFREVHASEGSDPGKPMDAVFGKRSIVCFHGYVGSPFDLRPLTERLEKEGFRVVVPVVPAQTRSMLAYRRGQYTPERYVEWMKKTIEAEIRLTGQKPYLIGFSMGGTLATLAAAMGLSERLVLLAPFYGLVYANRMVWALCKGIAPLVPLVPKTSRGKIFDPQGYKRYTPGSFLVSLSAFVHLQEMAQEACKAIPRISVPVLVVASANDQVASFRKTKALFAPIPNARIEEFPRSNHVLLYDYDRDMIVERIVSFLDVRSPQESANVAFVDFYRQKGIG